MSIGDNQIWWNTSGQFDGEDFPDQTPLTGDLPKPKNLTIARQTDESLSETGRILLSASSNVGASAPPPTPSLAPLPIAKQTDYTPDAGGVRTAANQQPPQQTAQPQITLARQGEPSGDAGAIILGKPSNYQFPPLSPKPFVGQQSEYNPYSGAVTTTGSKPSIFPSSLPKAATARQADYNPDLGQTIVSQVKAFAAATPSTIVYRKTRSEIGARTGSRQAGDK